MAKRKKQIKKKSKIKSKKRAQKKTNNLASDNIFDSETGKTDALFVSQPEE